MLPFLRKRGSLRYHRSQSVPLGPPVIPPQYPSRLVIALPEFGKVGPELSVKTLGLRLGGEGRCQATTLAGRPRASNELWSRSQLLDGSVFGPTFECTWVNMGAMLAPQTGACTVSRGRALPRGTGVVAVGSADGSLHSLARGRHGA